MSEASVRNLPAVHTLPARPELAEALARRGRAAVLRAVREVVEAARRDILSGRATAIDAGSLARRAAALIDGERPSLRRVLNASGVLLHTGLGRAPLAEEALAAVVEAARGYCNLEFKLDGGTRGRRSSGVSELVARLTGAEAAAVVNNNAGATVLALRALAGGREVVVSRGQLVEIGGSFRLPEILEVSGARLREVGTTNKTRIADYERAIGPETGALLRVHPSNYRIVGFTEEASLEELCGLGRARGLWVIDDIGSGSLGPGLPPGVAGEPSARAGIAAGADVVLFSGDKLLGGPQCGLIAGSRRALGLIESDPLMRALRVDKMTLAALEATLRLALDADLAAARIPLWSFLSVPLERLRERAERLAAALRDVGLCADRIDAEAYLGGGSVPVEPIATAAARVRPPFPGCGDSESDWAQRLRLGDPPVVPRVQGGAVLFDLRAIDERDDRELLDAIHRSIRAAADCSPNRDAVS
ncbi:MAG: L-seryl-tRNA(Sec) selenium transferase [Planctomycetota bacterium]|nr:L-seryl-tRNA(Sec) selenium transferase [Planctomycetota bacterium]